jgi:hypothetical protein
LLQYQTSNENAPPTKFLQSHRLLPRYIYPVFGRHGIPLLFPSPKRRICHGQTSVQPSQLSSKTTQLAFRTSSRTPSTLHRPPRTALPSRPPTGLPGTRLPWTAHQDPSTLHHPPRTALPSRLPCTAHQGPSTLHRPPKAVYPGPPTKARLPVYPGPPTKTRLPWTAHHRPPPPTKPSTLDRPPTGLPGPVYPGPPSVPSTQVPPDPSTLDRPPPGQVHLSRAVYPGPPARQGRKGGTVSGRPRSPRLRPPTSRSRSISPLPVRLAGSAPAGSRWEI